MESRFRSEKSKKMQPSVRLKNVLGGTYLRDGTHIAMQSMLPVLRWVVVSLYVVCSDFVLTELLWPSIHRGQRYLLKKCEDCGQPKIVVTCNSQNEMNELRAKAENVGLPVFTVADAGRTQVAAGSQTVLAIGPGLKTTVDSITRHLALL